VPRRSWTRSRCRRYRHLHVEVGVDACRADQLLRSASAPVLAVRFVLALLVALVTTPLTAATLVAQSGRPRPRVTPGPAPGQDDPLILTSGLLADPHTRDLLVNHAFPERMHFKLELWRKGSVFGDDLDGRTEWDMLVSYDPTRQSFNVIRRLENQFEDFGG